MMRIAGWGRHPVLETDYREPSGIAALSAICRDGDGYVARGNGRSYGDAAVGAEQTVSLRRLDRMRGFDPQTGLLTVESGVLLAEVIEALLPRGFFPAVVPGTRFVSVGGAIAADVHGKNHHRDGGFGRTVERLVLMLPGGETVAASRTERPDLFLATIGGMGLTGVILEATLRLRRVESGWIRQRTVAAGDLAATIAALDAADEASYSVAWIDCLARGRTLGRSLVFVGEHASAFEIDRAQKPRFPRSPPSRLTVPFDFPAVALNGLTMRAFNAAYYRAGAYGSGPSRVVAAAPYFFPLDGIGAWNRLYGPRGFVQHQCVLPLATGAAALSEILAMVSARGVASFLAVLKKLGPGEGLMSFPMPGYTLALDFPVGPGLRGFLGELDRVVVRAGGRLYLAKDSMQSRDTFEAGYPGLDRFRALRRAVDPDRRLRSHLSERLGV